MFVCVQTAEECLHRVRLAAGSGLRADVWREFVRRFGKIQIRESYGLTEASIGFMNYTDEVGPIGRATYFNKVSYSPQCAISSPSAIKTIYRCHFIQAGHYIYIYIYCIWCCLMLIAVLFFFFHFMHIMRINLLRLKTCQ